MVQPIPRTTQKDSDLKERVRAFWQEHPCGSKYSDAEIGTREFFDRVEQHRYEKEWHIPAAANFASTRGLKAKSSQEFLRIASTSSVPRTKVSVE